MFLIPTTKSLIILYRTRLAVVLPYECITRTCTHAHTHKYHSNILRKRCRRMRAYSQKLFPEIVCDMEECVLTKYCTRFLVIPEGGGVKTKRVRVPERTRSSFFGVSTFFAAYIQPNPVKRQTTASIVIIHTPSSHTTSPIPSAGRAEIEFPREFSAFPGVYGGQSAKTRTCVYWTWPSSGRRNVVKNT